MTPVTNLGPIDRPDPRVPDWVRLGLVALLAVPQMLIGLWAMSAPQHWFDSFPGVGPALIAGEPPFNQHLSSDVGAAFFAIGLGLALAARWGGRRPVQLALATLVAFTAPHVVYHVLSPAPGLSATANIANAALLAPSLGWAAVLWWEASRTGRSRRRGQGSSPSLRRSEEPSTSPG